MIPHGSRSHRWSILSSVSPCSSPGRGQFRHVSRPSATWIPCIKQFWLQRKMRVSEPNAAIGESREQSCLESAGNPSQRAASEGSTCPCTNSATQIRHTSRWQDCTGLAIVCRPVMAVANRNQAPVQVRPGKGWVPRPLVAAVRDRSSAEPPPPTPLGNPRRSVISNWQTGDILIGRLQARAA